MPKGYAGTCMGEEWYIGYITDKDGVDYLEHMVSKYTKCEIVSRHFNRVKNTYRVVIFAPKHQTIQAIRRATIRAKGWFHEMVN